MIPSDGLSLVAFDDDARDEIFKGIETVAASVGSTLGPAGRCVVIERPDGKPHVTKDGVTVSRSINLRNRLRAMGAELVKEAASQTNELAGDGTTTATVLTHAMCEEGRKLLAAGYTPTQIVNEMSQAVEEVLESLVDLATPVKDDDVFRVATISANGEESIARLIADAVEHVGRDGIVTVEESKSSETTLDVVNGLRLDRGYISPFFVTDSEKMRCDMVEPYILIADQSISSLADFVPVLEGIHRQGKPLLIIADDVEGEALKMLVMNRTHNNLITCVIRSPSYDMGAQKMEGLADIAALTNGTVCTEAFGGLSQMRLDHLGRARRVIVTRDSCTVIVGDHDEKLVESRVGCLRQDLEDPNLPSDVRLILQARLSRLAGSAAVIRVGGETEIEMAERRDRVDDALNAARAAIAEGVVPGGGSALFRIAAQLGLPGRNPGSDLIYNACSAPLRRIASNSGQSPAVIMEKVLHCTDFDQGWNAREGRLDDMHAVGIIDPVKVTRIALLKATSVAKSFLTLSAAITHDHGDVAT